MMYITLWCNSDDPPYVHVKFIFRSLKRKFKNFKMLFIPSWECLTLGTRLTSVVVGIGIHWPACYPHSHTHTHTHTLHTFTLPPSPWPQGYADLHILTHKHTDSTHPLSLHLSDHNSKQSSLGTPSPTGHLAFHTTHQTWSYIFTYASLLSLIIYKLFFFTWVLSAL